MHSRQEEALISTNSVATADLLASEIRIRDWLVFMLTVSSGAVDAVSFLALSRVFTAFMTGNIAFLGLGIADNPGAPSIATVLVPMARFAAGIYLATTIATRPMADAGEQPSGPVWPQRTTLVLGISLVAHLLFLVTWLVAGGRPGESATLTLLLAWSVAMGMQSAAVRWLDIGGVFTTAATATFISLVGNLAENRLASEERRRLLGVLASLIIGATAGGLLLHHARIYAPVLPLVITIVVFTMAAKTFGDREA